VASAPGLTTWLDILDATQLAVAPLADTIKVAVFDDTVVPVPSTDTAYNVAPWNAGEASGGTYTAGGPTLGSKTLSIVSSRVVFTSLGFTITTMTASVRYLLQWDDTVAGDRILSIHDLGQTLTLVAEPLVVNVPSTGWWRLG